MTEVNWPSILRSAVAIFVEHIPALALSAKGAIRLPVGNNAYIYDHKKLYTKLVPLLPQDKCGLLLNAVGAQHFTLEQGLHSLEFKGELEKALLAAGKGPRRSRAAEVNPDDVFFNNKIKTPLSKLRLVLDLQNKKSSFLYDPVKKKLHRIEYETIQKRLRSVLGDALPEWEATNTEDCYLTYLPGNTQRFIESPGEDTQFFNVWEEASWREGWKPEKQGCPQELEEFFQCFLADDESRYFTKAWVRDAIFDRAEPILILCGKPGVGKNIFVQSLVAQLLGVHNYRSAARGFHKSAFHGGISQCGVFFFDEMPLLHEGRETLKAYHNGLATIERKGIDVGDPEKIHASFVVANNRPFSIHLEYTDRKFYPPMLSDVPLKRSMGDAKLDKLVSLLENDVDFLRQVASYLLTTFQPQESSKFPKNAFFKQLCLNSYPYDFRVFIHACKELDIITHKTLLKSRRKSIDAFELKDSIDSYESQFEEPLAELTIRGDGTWVAQSKCYRNSAENSLPVAGQAEIGPGANGGSIPIPLVQSPLHNVSFAPDNRREDLQ